MRIAIATMGFGLSFPGAPSMLVVFAFGVPNSPLRKACPPGVP
jgi:hypothetical protein